MRPHFVVRVLLAAVAAVGAGCSLPKASPAQPPAAASGAARGGTLAIGITAPGGVDPLSFTDAGGLLLGSVLCETLVTIDPETGELKPGSLIVKWTVTDGGSRIIFQMRKDAYFHDGRQVRSADAFDSIKRLVDPANSSPMAELLETLKGYGQYREAIENNDLVPSLPGFRIIEPFSFELMLSAGQPDILRALAHPATAPASKAPYDRDPVAAPAFPQCAGPYRLTAPFKPGDREIVLHRFDRYNGGNTAFTQGGGGVVDELRFRLFPDPAAAYEAYTRGEVDIAPVPSARLMEARQRFGERVVAGDIAQEEFIALPAGSNTVFADRMLRRALSQAIDREALAATVYGGARRAADGFVPPALRTDIRVKQGEERRSVDYGCGMSVPVKGDADAARRTWAEGKGAEASRREIAEVEQVGLRFAYNDEPPHRAMAEAVAKQWQEVLGLQVRLEPMPWDAYVTHMLGHPGAFRTANMATYSSAEAFLRAQFAGDDNVTGYVSNAFRSALFGDLQPRREDGERALAVRRVEEHLCLDLPVIPIAFGQAHYVFGPRVTSARADRTLVSRQGDPLLREVAVTP